MSGNEKLKNSSSEKGRSAYRDVITHGHRGGGKVTKPPKNPPIPKLDTSAIPPSQGVHRIYIIKMPTEKMTEDL